MDKKYSLDPRSIRARQAFHQALIDLLKKKSFQKISVTDIARQAGLARHTFYNHYETKEDLLNSIIDSILNELFIYAAEQGIILDSTDVDPNVYQRIGVKFFQIWQENAEFVKALDSVDIDHLLIKRMKENFADYFNQHSRIRASTVGPALLQYLICFNAYASIGILNQWLEDGMRYPPEVMGEFLNHFIGVGQRVIAIEKFKDVIRY